MWIPGCSVYFVAILGLMARWYAQPETDDDAGPAFALAEPESAVQHENREKTVAKLSLLFAYAARFGVGIWRTFRRIPIDTQAPREYCHEINGLGGIREPELSNVGNRLTEQDMIIRILDGGKNIPGFAGILHPDQVTDLVAYLETLKTHPGPDITQAR